MGAVPFQMFLIRDNSRDTGERQTALELNGMAVSEGVEYLGEQRTQALCDQLEWLVLPEVDGDGRGEWSTCQADVSGVGHGQDRDCAREWSTVRWFKQWGEWAPRPGYYLITWLKVRSKYCGGTPVTQENGEFVSGWKERGRRVLDGRVWEWEIGDEQ